MPKKENQIIRCTWAGNDPVNIHYHDHEWGVPVYNDRLLFEFLMLEGAQAGLSWITILKRRDHYRKAFNHFEAEKIARYDEARIKKLLANPGIIRNQLKIRSVITNAQAYLDVKEEFSSFSDYIWQFVEGRPIQNKWVRHKQVPVTTAESDKMSKDLKKRGFKFAGSTICYAYMQAVGMVNDHLTTCFRYHQVKRKK